MAYREFEYEKYYESPDTSQAHNAQIQGITNLFRGMQQKRDERRKAVDQFQYDLDQGAFENDTKLLGELAKNVTGRAKNELRQSGKLSTETDMLMKDGLSYQQASKNQMERVKMLRQNITDRKGHDSYYNPQPDLDLLKEAVNGQDNDVDFRTRGERLDTAEKMVGGIQTFMFDNYKAQYVKDIGAQSKEREFPNKTGSSMTKFDQATFWAPDGKPGVTDQHAVRFLESEPRVSEYYDGRINQKLDQEIKAMKSSGDSRVDWMRGLSDAEIKAQLVTDPSKNIIDQTEYGARVRNMAKSDLQEADRVNSRVSYSNLQDDKNNSNGAWKNQNILHEYSMNNFAQEAKKEDGTMSTVNTYGVGGKFTQKSGRPITIDTNNPIRTDINKGITTRNNKGTFRFNLTGYQLMPVRSGGAPYALKGNSTDEMIQEVNNLPLEYFDPNGKMKLQPSMQIGMVGYTINEAGVLGDIKNQLLDISSKIKDATAAGDKEKLASLEDMEYNLNELKQMVGAGDYDADDLMLAGNKAGVRKIQNDVIIPANSSDIATIKNVTGGFDLNSQDYWSPEMKAVNDAYTKRAEEAKKRGYGAKTEKTKTQIVNVKTQEDYNKLPSGAEYIGPDGKKRKKK